MGVKQTGRYCPICKKHVMATGTTPNHLLHFFLCLFALFLWVPIWILVIVSKVGAYRCASSGSRV